MQASDTHSSPDPQRSKRGRRIMRVVRRAAFCATLLFVFAIIALQTGLVKTWIANYLSAQFSNEARTVTISGLRGYLPFGIHIESITVSDVDSPWLLAEDVYMNWKPMYVNGFGIQIDDSGARVVELLRLPHGAEKDSDTDAFAISLSSESILRAAESLPKISLKRLNVDMLILPQQTEGRNLAVTLNSSGEITDSGDNLIIEIRDRSQLPLRVNTSITFDRENRSFEIDATSIDNESGLLAALLGYRGNDRMRAEISGSGPISDWTFRFNAGEGTEHWLAGTGGIALTNGISAEIQTEMNLPPSILPEAFGELAEEHITLNLSTSAPARIDASSWLTLRVEAESSYAHVVFAGRYQIGNQLVDADTHFTISDLSEFADVMHNPTSGRLEGEIQATGSLRKLTLTPSLSLTDLKMDEATLGSSNLEGRVDFANLNNEDSRELSFELRGSIADGLYADRWQLDGTFVDLTLAGAAHASGRIDASLDIDSSKLNFRAATRLDGSYKETYRALSEIQVDDLGRLGELFGIEIVGRSNTAIEFTHNTAAEEWSLDLSGSTHDLDVGGMNMRSAIGDGVTFAANATRRQGRTVNIEHLGMLCDALEVNASGIVDLDASTLQLSIDGGADDLSAFSSLAGQNLKGQAVAEVSVEGELANPAINGLFRVTDLSLEKRRLEKTEAKLTLTGLSENATGTIDLKISNLGDSISIFSKFEQMGEDLNLEPLQISGPGIAGNGRIKIGAGYRPLSMDYEFTGSSLSAVGQVLGIPISGSLDIDLDMGRESSDAYLKMVFAGDELTYGDLKLGSIISEANIRDPFENGQCDLTLALNNTQTSFFTIDTASFTAVGNLASLRYKSTLSGHSDKPFSLSMQGALERSATRYNLSLSELAADYAGENLSLDDSFDVAFGDSFLSIAPTTFRVSGAPVNLTAKRDGELIEASIDAREIPLRLASLLGGPILEGTSHMSLTASGTVKAPIVDAKVGLAGFFVDGAEPLRLESSGRYIDQSVQITATAQGAHNRPSQFTLRFPAKMTIAPPKFVVDAESPVDGDIAAYIDLEYLAELLASSMHIAEGTLYMDASIDGSIGSPQLNGNARLSDAIYENLSTGTLLRDLELEAEFTGRELSVIQLRASDGAGGTVRLSGELNWDKQLSFQLDSKFEDARLVRRAVAVATVNGQVGLDNREDITRLRGTLNVSPAEVNIARVPPAKPKPIVVRYSRDSEDAQSELASTPTREAVQQLEIDVEFPNRLRIHGRGLESEWRGNLTITGSSRAPSVRGNLLMVRGTFDFLNKKWDMKDSRISLDGQTPVDPLMNLTARTRSGSIEALLRIIGPVSNPTISLESTPPLSQDAILSQVLFGRPLAQISPAQALQLAAAARQLSATGGDVFSMVGSLRSALNLDTLSIEAGPGGIEDPRIGVGRYLTERVYLQVQQDIFADETEAKIEFTLSPRWSLIGIFDTLTGGGLSLTYHFDY